jgi:hypothetical protein
VTLKFQTGKLTAATPADSRQQQQAERQQTAVEQIVNQDPHVRDMQERLMRGSSRSIRLTRPTS